MFRFKFSLSVYEETRNEVAVGREQTLLSHAVIQIIVTYDGNPEGETRFAEAKAYEFIWAFSMSS